MEANCNEINLQKNNWNHVSPSRRDTPQLNKHKWTADSSKREEARLVTEQKAFDIGWRKPRPMKIEIQNIPANWI